MINERTLSIPRIASSQSIREGIEAYSVPLEQLTDANWRLYAARWYDNPQSMGEDEFEQDLKRFKYIKKAITKYKASGEMTERLILNHLIVLNNVFGPQVLCRLVFLKMTDHLSQMKPFLLYLKVLPSKVRSVNGRDWNTDDIIMDQKVIDLLRRI